MGEHVELHMLVGSINKGRSIQGFIDKGLVEPQNIKKRHEQLVKEILKRGYKHNSPLPEFETYIVGSVNKQKSYRELMRRCEKCKKRICP